MNLSKGIKVSEKNREEMLEKITRYFYEERCEALGELASQLILDFVLEELAPNIYNQGVEDSYLYLETQLEDLHALKKTRRG